ncbi:unnamed protein product [Rotaria sordida]|uniref:Uncharacterized protein n=1 Tax=Rotaria sordida TaxID=392033 RepID=A0A815GE66_9BILA|nr:unnamed protein product [Rotaria sordida]
MLHQLIVFCLCFATTLSIRCYLGMDNECLLAPDAKDCGSGDACRCIKYRFTCTEDDDACNQQEKSAGTTKWVYSLTSESVCEAYKDAISSLSDMECCSTDRCNRPDNVECSSSNTRRRLLRKFTDLFDV